jgi:hypothetical protein
LQKTAAARHRWQRARQHTQACRGNQSQRRAAERSHSRHLKPKLDSKGSAFGRSHRLVLAQMKRHHSIMARPPHAISGRIRQVMLRDQIETAPQHRPNL